MISLREGDLVHVARYGHESCDMWALVGCQKDERDALYGPRYSALIVWGGSLPSNRTPYKRELVLDGTDSLSLSVPVPDYVYVELAKWQLTGGVDELDE